MVIVVTGGHGATATGIIHHFKNRAKVQGYYDRTTEKILRIVKRQVSK